MPAPYFRRWSIQGQRLFVWLYLLLFHFVRQYGTHDLYFPPFRPVKKPPSKCIALKKRLLRVLFQSLARLFRQVLFVLQAVPDVLDAAPPQGYEFFSIVQPHYTTFKNISQARYFISELLIFGFLLYIVPICLDRCDMSLFYQSQKYYPAALPCHMSQQSFSLADSLHQDVLALHIIVSFRHISHNKSPGCISGQYFNNQRIIIIFFYRCTVNYPGGTLSSAI